MAVVPVTDRSAPVLARIAVPCARIAWTRFVVAVVDGPLEGVTVMITSVLSGLNWAALTAATSRSALSRSRTVAAVDAALPRPRMSATTVS